MHNLFQKKGENSFQFILWSWYDPNTKSRQWHYRKIIPQISISHEYRCNYPQKSISKPNPTVYTKNYTSWQSGTYPSYVRVVQHQKLTTIIHHINRPKKQQQQHTHNHINRCRKCIWENSTAINDKKKKNSANQEYQGTYWSWKTFDKNLQLK